MQVELELIEDVLKGKTFQYREKPHLSKRNYVFKDCSEVTGGKIKLETDLRTFILLPNEVANFVNMCEVIEQETIVKNVVLKKPVYIQNENFEKISGGLLEMFDKVSSGQATDDDFKKAKAMVDISGKIIDMEKIKLSLIAKNRI